MEDHRGRGSLSSTRRGCAARAVHPAPAVLVAPIMSPYLLAQHTHVCLTEDYAVVLDLKADRYFALAGPQLRVLNHLVRGWPECESRDAAATVLSPDDSGTSVVDHLIERGVLTTDARLGKLATPLSFCAPATTLIDTTLVHTLLADQACERPRVRARDVGNFVGAYAVAASSLRWHSMERVVRRVRVRKQERAESSVGPDLGAARDHVWIFRLLRPFFFAARQRCLLQSLTLIEFLARYGIFPTWVFGVRSGPFAAHCWVQEQTVVFNDTPEHVRRYTPIMAI